MVELAWLLPFALLAFFALELRAQDSGSAGGADPAEEGLATRAAAGGDTAALTSALLEHFRLGSGHYVRHCRRAYGGCEARARRMAALFVQAGGRYRLDPFLLAAIALRESGGNPDAVGHLGEVGLMQLNPSSRAGMAAIRLCAEHPRDCQQIQIAAACGVLRASLDACGSLGAALGRYHSGRCGEDAYARSVLARRDRMRGSS